MRPAFAVAFFFAVRALAEEPAAVLFRDVTREAGITFQHHSAPDKKYIVESMSGGVALFDFDNDGLVDVYFVDSLTVDTANDPKAARSALYRNLGQMKFEDVTDKAGVGHPGWGMGVCTADVDGDGWEDLYVTALGGSRLYRNDRDGTFADVTGKAGVAGSRLVGGLRLRRLRPRRRPRPVREPLREDRSRQPARSSARARPASTAASPCSAARAACPARATSCSATTATGGSPRSSEAAGVSDPRGYFGLGVAWFDYDEDGWPDLYVANDSRPSFLYTQPAERHVQGGRLPDGRGRERGRRRAGRHGRRGRRLRRLGALQPLQDELRRGVQQPLPRRGRPLHRRVRSVEDAARPACPTSAGAPPFFDYDNDGWLDIIAVNGHVYPQLDQARLGASAGYRQRKLLYRNRGDGTFDEIGARVTGRSSPSRA